MATDFVDDFLARYRKEYDFFDQAARAAARILEDRLRAAGIRAIVTSRAKALGRLKEKVLDRGGRRPGAYLSVEDIFDDIVDLAGVRVALYFPGEHAQVDKIIRGAFDVHREKRFPPQLAEPARGAQALPYENRFSGYWARHYRVRLKESALKESGMGGAQARYAEARIEIQVASVLMHSWAEVNHDLVYKPLQGRLSEDELAILDELNGLVLAGEIALERLQKAGEARVAAEDREFSDHYDLASHLHGKFAPSVKGPLGETALGHVDLLFEFLRELGLGTPGQLKRYIESLNPGLEALPLAQQIIDRLIGEDRRRYQIYEGLRARRLATDKQLGGAPAPAEPEAGEAANRFLERWFAFEQGLNEEAKKLDADAVYASSTLLSRLGVTDETLLKDFERLRRMRNEVVHRLSMPPPEELRAAGQRVAEISDELDRLTAAEGRTTT